MQDDPGSSLPHLIGPVWEAFVGIALRAQNLFYDVLAISLRAYGAEREEGGGMLLAHYRKLKSTDFKKPASFLSTSAPGS